MPRRLPPHTRMHAADDPVWAAFCAGVDPLQAHRAPKPKGRAAKQSTIVPPGGHAPILAPIYLAEGEAEDFGQLMQEWEAGNGRFTEPAPKAAMHTAEPLLNIDSITNLAGTGAKAATPKSASLAPVLDQWHGVDAATMRSISRGQMAVDAVLDLHGLSVENAFESVCGMVQLGRMRGWRLLLVITGKGTLNAAPLDDVSKGKIRRALPNWLRDGRVAPHVVAVSTAHVRHGGAGAFYFLLRRADKGSKPVGLGELG